MERKVDELGRIVIPKHIRKKLGLETKTKVSFETDGERLIVTKAYPTCAICGSDERLIDFRGKPICADCISMIRR